MARPKYSEVEKKIMKGIALNLKAILKRKGMSQKELAVQMDKNPNTITSICNNKSQPHLKDLKRIAEILDVDIRELLVPTK